MHLYKGKGNCGSLFSLIKEEDILSLSLVYLYITRGFFFLGLIEERKKKKAKQTTQQLDHQLLSFLGKFMSFDQINTTRTENNETIKNIRDINDFENTTEQHDLPKPRKSKQRSPDPK